MDVVDDKAVRGVTFIWMVQPAALLTTGLMVVKLYHVSG
jgi:hypothetical protein